MIPEAGQSHAVDIYRAEDFPYRWTHAARLDEGRDVYDTTPLELDGAMWFFTSLRTNKSSTWDILGIYRADGLTGPWTPHAQNPVVIDAGLSRPAGAFIREGARVLRPVQDCGRYYGGGLRVCRIDALTETAFAQTPVGRICAGPHGCHTYNRSGGIEVVDLFGNLGSRRQVPVSYWPETQETPSASDLPEPVPHLTGHAAT
jgi:hypothetical protein